VHKLLKAQEAYIQHGRTSQKQYIHWRLDRHTHMSLAASCWHNQCHVQQQHIAESSKQPHTASPALQCCCCRCTGKPGKPCKAQDAWETTRTCPWQQHWMADGWVSQQGQTRCQGDPDPAVQCLSCLKPPALPPRTHNNKFYMDSSTTPEATCVSTCQQGSEHVQ